MLLYDRKLCISNYDIEMTPMKECHDNIGCMDERRGRGQRVQICMRTCKENVKEFLLMLKVQNGEKNTQILTLNMFF